jgi:regulator of protease activity HflC (stomatin/prohibitin superfamily)
MAALVKVLIVLAVLALLVLALSVRIVKQYEKGVLFRLGRVIGVREPGLTLIVPLIDILRRVSLRIITMPIQSQGIIARENVSIGVSAVAYYQVVEATKSVVAIESAAAAINRSPRPPCARSSASTPWTRPWPRPTASTSTSARSSTWRPRRGAWW